MKKHTHKPNKKGFCSICGQDMTRHGKEEKHDKHDEKEMKKEGKEHPEFSKKQIHQIVEDHEKAHKK
jgi:hypothetical protein